MISLCRSGGKRGAYDSIMAMKTYTTIEYVHGNVFPGQGKEKVYVFKMLEDRPGSGVDLVKRMQPGRDLENAWLMFDHIKRVKEWTTMACHVYEGPMYHVDRTQRSHGKERRREYQLQRLHGGQYTGQLECCPNRLWQW
jgi:hypothetical protein